MEGTLGSQAQHTHSLEDHTRSIQQRTSTHTKHIYNIQQQNSNHTQSTLQIVSPNHSQTLSNTQHKQIYQQSNAQKYKDITSHSLQLSFKRQ